MRRKDDDPICRAFGLVLRTLRLQKGYSQEGLGRKDISRGHISEMENGLHNPTLTTLMYLADRLDMPFNRLAWEIELQYQQLVFEDNREVHMAAIAVEDGVLVVTLRGVAEFHAGLRLYREILDQAQQEQVNRILMDCLEVTGVIPDGERYRIATELAAYLKERQLQLKLATVGRVPTVTGYGAAVAREQGANLAVFDTVEAARAWLDE